MATVRLAPAALEDIERLIAFLMETDRRSARETMPLIFEAFGILSKHPLIGRPAPYDLRELVIFRGRAGYVALYQYRPDSDEVLITAIRHQREVGDD